MQINKKLKIYSRIVSGSFRAYPGFLIIGAQKAATTTLFHYLGQHPQVILPLKKEIHYFDTKYNNGSLWYRAHFPLKNRISPDQITGEKSTDYIFHPLAAERIHSSTANPRMIVLLRDPVRRAISHYHHNKRSGKEKRSMKPAFDEEQNMLSKWEPALSGGTIFHQKALKNYHRYAYLKKGLYLEQIKRFHQYFGPDKLLIESSENFLADPASFFQQVCTFLNIDPFFSPTDLAPQNKGRYKLDDETEDMISYLKSYYTPHNKALFNYLDRHFPWE